MQLLLLAQEHSIECAAVFPDVTTVASVVGNMVGQACTELIGVPYGIGGEL